jgi:hypothetical protein
MARQAMWAHGHSATIQLNERGRTESENLYGIHWTSLEGLRKPWGVMYRCQDDSEYWFHLPIPSPVWRDGVRAHLDHTGVIFRADPGVTLRTIAVFDGGDQILIRDHLAIGGVNHTLIEGRNWFGAVGDEREHGVLWGIGVSVKFHFADPGNVILQAAGVDVEV